MITQSSKGRYSGVIFDQFPNFYIYITAIGKIWNLLSYDACYTIIYALISCRANHYNYIMYNVPMSKTDILQKLHNQCIRILTKSPRREHITPVLKKKYIGSKFKTESYTQF